VRSQICENGKEKAPAPGQRSGTRAINWRAYKRAFINHLQDIFSVLQKIFEKGG
jgi:hypothetical protein